MSILISIGTVLFVILSILLIIIILLQSDKSAGMGILGGASNTAFGSSTADIITKITTVMVALFMVGSLGLSVVESYRARSLEKDLLNEEKSGGVIEQKALEKPQEQSQQPK
jgi:preprotein translocase subunit SecG